MVVRYFLDHNEGTSRPATDIIRVFHIGYPPRINGYWSGPACEDLCGQLDGRTLFLGRSCFRSFEADRHDAFEGSVVYHILDEGLVSMPSADGRRCYVLTDMDVASGASAEVRQHSPDLVAPLTTCTGQAGDCA